MQNEIRANSFNILPPVVKNLLIINGLFFLAKIALRKFNVDLDALLGLHFWQAPDFHPWQIITYMFMHGDFGHIFFNMFALWMFGASLENLWGQKRFLTFYILTGIGAAAIHYIIIFFQISPEVAILNQFLDNPTFENLMNVSQHKFHISQYADALMFQDFVAFQSNFEQLKLLPNNVQLLNECTQFIAEYKEFYLNSYNIIGASGSVFGLLLAFGMTFPNAQIFLYFLFPIRAKWFVIAYGAIELFYGVAGTADGVAHFAHLGGMLVGIILILIWRKKDKNRQFHYWEN